MRMTRPCGRARAWNRSFKDIKRMINFWDDIYMDCMKSPIFAGILVSERNEKGIWCKSKTVPAAVIHVDFCFRLCHCFRKEMGR